MSKAETGSYEQWEHTSSQLEPTVCLAVLNVACCSTCYAAKLDDIKTVTIYILQLMFP